MGEQIREIENTAEQLTRKERIRFASKLLGEYKTIKGHLSILDRKIKIAKNTLRCQDSLGATSIGSIGSTHISNIVESIVIREIEKIEKMEFNKMIYQNILLGLDDAINSLRGKEKEIITLYYIDNRNLTWKEVATEVLNGEDYVRGPMRENALLQVSKTILGVEEINNLHNIAD